MRTSGKVQCRKVQRVGGFCRGSVRERAGERVRLLSRHNSETTSKPYPIPNTYEEEEEEDGEATEEEERVKFNEIRSGVLNKISGLDSARVPSFPPVRTNERRHKKGGLAQIEQGREGLGRPSVGLFEPIKRSHRAN